MSSELSILFLYGLVVLLTIPSQLLATLGPVSLMDLSRTRDNRPELTVAAGRLLRTVF